MKIASFNVENLFDRAKIFNENNAISDKINKSVAELNNLLAADVYTAADKVKIVQLLTDLGLDKSDESPYVILRKNKGKLLKRSTVNPLEVEADGRADWIGWIELKRAPVNEIAITNTAQVLRDVNADIMVVVEAENRVALKQYSEVLLKKVGGQPYDEIMVIDGNDDRGIDVGIMTKNGYKIGLMQSHVHDKDATGKLIFSRDCPEYAITTPTGEQIWVLPNHFKSKFGGDDPVSKAKRLKQAEKVKEIYNRLIAEGKTNVVILGDLNDTPGSDPLAPLLQQTDLRDIATHPTFVSESKVPTAKKGTFGLGNDGDKIDYILLSPSLFARITACGLFRKGAWPGKAPKRWAVYPELKKEIHAASDHHLIWVEFL